MPRTGLRIVSGSACKACAARLVPRSHKPKAGEKRHGSHGLCTTCEHKNRKRSRPKTAAQPSPTLDQRIVDVVEEVRLFESWGESVELLAPRFGIGMRRLEQYFEEYDAARARLEAEESVDA